MQRQVYLSVTTETDPTNDEAISDAVLGLPGVVAIAATTPERISEAMDLVDHALGKLERYDDDTLGESVLPELRDKLALAYDKLQNARRA